MKKTIAFILAISIFSSIVSALEVPEVTDAGILPTQPFFYLLKTNIKEPVSLMFKTGDADLQERLRLLEVRRLELERVSKLKGANMQELQEKILNNQKRQLENIERRGKGMNLNKIAELEDLLFKHIARLSEVVEKVPENGKEGVRKAMTASSKVFQALIVETVRMKEDLRVAVDSNSRRDIAQNGNNY